MAKLRREAGGRLDDDAALLLMARQVLGGPSDSGRSSYQLAVTRCSDCQRAHVHASGERVEVGPEVVEMIDCDAQHIGPVEPESEMRQGSSTHMGNGSDLVRPSTTSASARRSRSLPLCGGRSSIATAGAARCPGVVTSIFWMCTISSLEPTAAITIPII